jgi:hypothetical protein
LSNTSAVPRGARSPRSQCRKVAAEKPKRAANYSWVHAHLGAHGLYIDGAGTMHTHAAHIAFGVRDRFLQTLFDAFKCGAYDDVLPFQMSVNTSTKSARSLRSAFVRLAQFDNAVQCFVHG